MHFKPVKRVITGELGSFIITDPEPVLGKGSYGGAVKAKIDAKNIQEDVVLKIFTNETSIEACEKERLAY